MYAAAIAGRYGWEGLGGPAGDELRMVSRVSVGGAGRSGDGLRMVVSRVCVYVHGLEGLGCEWLAGLVCEGLGCVGFVYKIVEITAVSSNNSGSGVLGLLCMGRNRAGSNLAMHFDFFSLSNFSILSVDRSHLRRNKPISVVPIRLLFTANY